MTDVDEITCCEDDLIIQVCLGEFEGQIHFESGILISLEGPYIVEHNHEQLSGEEFDLRLGVKLALLPGKRVQRAVVSCDGLNIFVAGIQFRFLVNNKGFESFQVRSKDKIIAIR